MKKKTIPTDKPLQKLCTSTTHQLCNILGALVGELDYGLKATGTGVRERSMNVALSAAQQAIELCRNLQQFALLSETKNVTCDVSQILLDVVDVLEKEIQVRGLRIAASVEAPAYIQCDQGALQQAFLNILLYTIRGSKSSGKLSVFLGRQEPSLIFTCGVEDRQFNAAEIDTQLEDPFKEVGGNSEGPALFVASALIAACGGNLSVKSGNGIASSLQVTFPYDATLAPPRTYEKKRRYRRVQAKLPTVVQTGQHQFPSELISLGLGGCFLRLDKKKLTKMPELGDEISIKVNYIGDQALHIQHARVANVCWAGTQSGVGVEFLNLDEKATHVLRAIIQSHSI